MSAATIATSQPWVEAARTTLESMRRMLDREREAEARDLAMPAEDRGEDTTPSQHPADVASDLEAHEFTLTRELIDLTDLREVEAALERIDHGAYGLCVECGREIPRERLEVRPQAARDVECERRWRKEQRTYMARSPRTTIAR